MSEPREELLIHRTLEHAASPDDWAELRQAAAADPGLAERLLDRLEDEGMLRRTVEKEIEGADQVELPRPPARHAGRAGWAAAGLLALAWLGSLLLPGDSSPSLQRPAPPDPTPVSHAGASRPAPDVVGELPTVVIETLPAASGRGYEVLFLRQTLERVRVEEVLELAEDEHGFPAPNRVLTAPLLGTEKM